MNWRKHDPGAGKFFAGQTFQPEKAGGERKYCTACHPRHLTTSPHNHELEDRWRLNAAAPAMAALLQRLVDLVDSGEFRDGLPLRALARDAAEVLGKDGSR